MDKQYTGKHKCITCLKEIPKKEFFKNDHICDECADKPEYTREAKCELGCKHVPHSGLCNEPMTKDGKVKCTCLNQNS